MAQTWLAKAPSEVVERRWKVPLAECDGISTVSTSATGVTVDSDDYCLDEAVIVLSAGSAADTASVVVTVTTTAGLTLSETFLIAIRAEASQFTFTAEDICTFALRKLKGNRGTADSYQLADALERLNDMLMLWRTDGLDIGVQAVLVLGDTLEIPDEYVPALKWNLMVSCHDHYGFPITEYEALMARDTRRLVGNSLFEVSDLSMPRTLQGGREAETVILL